MCCWIDGMEWRCRGVLRWITTRSSARRGGCLNVLCVWDE